jgi:hypothetical protein
MTMTGIATSHIPTPHRPTPMASTSTDAYRLYPFCILKVARLPEAPQATRTPPATLLRGTYRSPWPGALPGLSLVTRLFREMGVFFRRKEQLLWIKSLYHNVFFKNAL